MRTCVVPFCRSSSKRPVQHLQFFKITRNRRENWMRALKRCADDTVHKDACVCSEHFVEKDFVVVNGKRSLKENAVPNVNLRPFATVGVFQGIELCFGAPRNIEANVSTLPSRIGFDSDQNEVVPQVVLREVTTDSSTDSDSSIFSKCADNNVFQISSGRKRRQELTSTDSEGLKGTLKKQRKVIRMFHTYCKSPRKLDRSLTESKTAISTIRATLKTEKAKVKRFRRKISSLSDIVTELKKLKLISGDARLVLEKCFAGVPLEITNQIIHNNENGTLATEKYAAEIKKFALTLQFYSSKACDYVRKTFNLALPCPRTLRNCLSNVNSMPGFTKQAFVALENKVGENSDKNTKTICSLMLDEITIKQQIEFQANRVWGYIDCGTEVEDDQLDLAREALVLMVVAVNGHWKVHIGYFLIKSLTAQEKANIVQQALIMLHEVGIIITSLTCDGPSADFSMVKMLGAKVHNVHEIEPYFSHPVDGSHIFVIFDVCHMLKLLGNVWAMIKIFHTSDGLVDYKYIEKLYELLQTEGFSFGTKLKNKHTEWMKQKMKVNITAQVLSDSVASALEFLMEDVNDPFFKDAGPTIKFIQLMDCTFDLLNSRSPFGRGPKSPLRENNKTYWHPIFHQACQFFKSCRDVGDALLISTPKKTPFLGFLITIKSITGIFDKFVVQDAKMKYLLTYKFSQDHLELFFCGIRSRNGGNNNPTAYQFCHTYKRMLDHHDIKNNNGNCLISDKTDMLDIATQGGSSATTPTISIDDISILKKMGLSYDSHIQDHKYYMPALPLILLSMNVVVYIAGYVVKMTKRHIKCPVCVGELEEVSSGAYDDSFTLLNRKNNGGLIKPSQNVVFVCAEVENQIRKLLTINDEKVPKEDGFFDSFVYVLTNEIFQTKTFGNLHEHMLNTSFVDGNTSNHVRDMIKVIVACFCKIRFHSLVKKQTGKEAGRLIRKSLSRLIIFNHQ